ncbi:MAG: tRNA-(ms[2]io[6]A)-hydroxylase [Candidatus Azotimanducaceae bacterium]
MTQVLKACTPEQWLAAVLQDFDEFLNDHAANERKASAMAMSMVAHYPDKPKLLAEMLDLALEELGHYRQVMKLMLARGITPSPDEKDPYVNQLIKRIRKGSGVYFLDRLLSGAVIEARGAERFKLIADAHKDKSMRRFYESLARSEAGHHEMFLNLASVYFETEVVNARWQEWLTIEAEVMLDLPIRARLH